MEDLNQKVNYIHEEFDIIKSTFNIDEKKKRLYGLEADSLESGFWDDQEKARRVMQEVGDLKSDIENFEKLDSDVTTLVALAKDGQIPQDFEKEIRDLEKKVGELKLKSFLSGPYDKKDAIVAIHSGQGGTEAMDWVSMLYRMYVRFCEKRGWSTQTIDFTGGEEAGIKSVTFKVKGNFAYGYLKGEAGTHRLVRQSPFNADKLRQTSFALVEVLPEFEEVDLPDIEIRDDDLEWQFFRSSSQGGQNVQKVSTAVRVKHVPTGITVTAQSERFQEQNRKIALNLLRSKLWILYETRTENEIREIKGEYRPASWGTQIRSYVLHPYKMVKDLRTNIESSNPELVLNGEIDEFIEAELALKTKSS